MKFVSTTNSLIADDQRHKINDNLVASRLLARYQSFYFGAILFTVAVAGAALFVDYQIVTEFWTRALANEFLELPGSLASSVAFKSLQVLFATLAAHIFIEQMGGFGRAVFVRVLFLLALVMLGGVGLLLALMSLPAGLADAGAGGPGGSLGSALAGLGLETESSVAAAASQSQLDGMRAYQPIMWMASLGVIFLVVTGVAAIFLHYALNNLKKLFDSRDYAERKADMDRLAALEAEYARNREALIDMERIDHRRNVLWTRLMESCRAYERGLEGVRGGATSSRRVLALPSPGSRRNNRNDRDRIKACMDSQQVARYEAVFEDWWTRRQRMTMNDGTVRTPLSEVLPPVNTSPSEGAPRFPKEKAAE